MVGVSIEEEQRDGAFIGVALTLAPRDPIGHGQFRQSKYSAAPAKERRKGLPRESHGDHLYTATAFQRQALHSFGRRDPLVAAGWCFVLGREGWSDLRICTPHLAPPVNQGREGNNLPSLPGKRCL